MTNEKYPSEQPEQPTLNWWAVYGVCLLISAIFFFVFGLNSPIYTFNSENDYNWFITMGHGLVGGKLPYRDLFEQKGPITYFVTAFCCLFQNPNFVMLWIEIFTMSLFFFFTYRIAKKRLNTFYSLLTVTIMAVLISTSWCRTRSAAVVEEFILPIYAYFLLCWIEFLLDKKDWNWVRALCLGLCFGIILWVKYTLVYFMLVPMIIWLIQSMREKKYRTIILNLLLMVAGVIMITLPIVIFFATNHALSDLIHVYFLLNLTAYGTTDALMVLSSFGVFFVVGPLVLFFIIWGVVRFAIKYWHQRVGWLLLIAFLINLALLVWSARGSAYYYIGVLPYAILGIIDLLMMISQKITLPRWHKWLYVAITVISLIISIPCSVFTLEWGRGRNAYTPLVIADEIHNYETTNHVSATLFTYKIGDFGFYNAAGIIPSDYYFANNLFAVDRLPEMYEGFERSISEQHCDFVITERKTWDNETDFLSQYYQPYHGTIEASTYHYHKMHYFYYREFDFVLLIKKS